LTRKPRSNPANPIPITIVLLICSNVFMTFAWYAHLKELNNKPWLLAALVSWVIVLLDLS